MYIELHASSAFSFLDGASLPEALVDRAAELGYSALALLDRDGVYGAPRFHKAALAAGEPVTLDRSESIADGLLPVRTGTLTFKHVRELVDDVVLVDDDAIRSAARKVLDGEAKPATMPEGWDGQAAKRIVDILQRDLERTL